MEGSLSRNDTLAATCWSDDNISFAVIRGSIRGLDKANLSGAVVFGLLLVFLSIFFFFFSFGTEQAEILDVSSLDELWLQNEKTIWELHRV